MWTKETLIEALEKQCVLTTEEKQSFQLLWKAKLKCEEVKGCYIEMLSPPKIEVIFMREPKSDWEKRNDTEYIISRFTSLAKSISYWKGLCGDKETDHRTDRLYTAQEKLLYLLEGLRYGGISIVVDGIKTENLELFE